MTALTYMAALAAVWLVASVIVASAVVMVAHAMEVL